MSSTATAESATGRTSCPLGVLCKMNALRHRPEPKKSYPPTSSIPETSPERLAAAAEDVLDNPNQPESATYLYLAYGSNLCADTFQGARGIRPLSQKNVHVPTLELKFNLPGIPYREPCFANVDYRKLPEKPKLPDPINPSPLPPIEPPTKPPHTTGQWNDGLVGVVYEVTAEDYRTIIRTEGGGASYKEILVPCLAIPPKMTIPEKPPIPEIPRPFLARTLYAPFIPDSDLPDDPRKKKWWYRFLLGPQRDPEYAQASARYLKLITDGAKEHDLPDDYQDWLNSLQPYKITSPRQQIGALILLSTWGVLFLSIITMSRYLADKDGKLPKWLAALLTITFNLIWMTYDFVFKPLFGDGERTEEPKKEKLTRPLRRGSRIVDEEKVSLLSEYE